MMDGELASSLKALIRSIGISPTEAKSLHTELIRNGGNNQGYTVTLNDRTFFVKRYFQDPNGGRDRGASEYAFASMLWRAGIRCIAQPLAFDRTHSAALFSFLPGKPLSVPISEEHVSQAALFFQLMNGLRGTTDAQALGLASEASFTLHEYIEGACRRIDRLSTMPLSSSTDRRANLFVRTKLIPCWEKLCSMLGKSGNPLQTPCPPNNRCLSPSDFGFHNALSDAGSLYFFDFEYAGWDDPTKMVCDFFHQPRYPVPRSLLRPWIGSTARALACDESWLSQRVENLFPLSTVRWCTILLNEFLPVGKSRREFSGAATDDDRKQLQLEKAETMLSAIDCIDV
jgi:hypothetical protein